LHKLLLEDLPETANPLALHPAPPVRFRSSSSFPSLAGSSMGPLLPLLSTLAAATAAPGGSSMGGVYQMSRNSDSDSDYAFSAGPSADHSGLDAADFGEDYREVQDYRAVEDYSPNYRAGVGGQAVDYRTDYSVEYLDTQDTFDSNQGTFDSRGASNQGTFGQQDALLQHSRHQGNYDQNFFYQDSFGQSNDYY